MMIRQSSCANSKKSNGNVQRSKHELYEILVCALFLKFSQQEQKRKEEEERELKEQMLTSNPLLSEAASSAAAATTGDYSIKRKWYDDAVFKNSSKSEPEVKKRFINDTIRSDFHRNFLNKFIK